MANYWQNWKSIPLMLFPWNLKVEAVGLKNYNYTWKIVIYEGVKFAAISWKIDILPITS